MSNESREAFEAWYHPNFFNDPKTLAWAAWKASRKQALEDAVDRVTTLYEFDEPPYLVDICKAIEESK
jgi:hypothetical protein